jgi:NAD(P)-dependent dehydrogenase (short-subunit alcohol dehydrogenase family)
MRAIEKFRVDGKTAIVTGATKGLGRQMAAALASGGANVVVNSRNADEAAQTAQNLAAEFGIRAVGCAGDVAQLGVAEQLVDAARSLGGLDILINNAGVNVRGSIEAVTPADFDHVLLVNMKGPWLLCRAAAPVFKAQKAGRVVNIASTLGLVGLADRTLYCTSKGALVQFTRALALEWAPDQITVNAICPGPFETEMNRTLVSDPVKYQQFANYTALRRWGQLDEIGPVVLFLASDAASYITGAILPVDGGWVAY